MSRNMPRRRGFTIIEVTLVAGLSVFLAVLLSSVWKNINLFTADAVGRGQLMQEMDMAAASLSRDLAGSLPILATASVAGGTLGDGKPDTGRWVAWQHPGDDELWLAYDSGSCPNGVFDGIWTSTMDTVIRYHLDPDPDPNVTTKVLVRENRTDATSFTVARGVNSMTVEEDAGFAKIALQFKYQQRSGAKYFGPIYLRKFTLEARAPQ
jgi:hypothetical protein